MNTARRIALLVTCVLASGCETDTVLGFAIGDISGIWQASAYEYVSNADGALRVDLIARDGASMTLSVSSNLSAPLASSTFNDGMGGTVSGGGAVDVRSGTLAIEQRVYAVEHNGNSITLTDAAAMYDFGRGEVSATHIIRLSRLGS